MMPDRKIAHVLGFIDQYYFSRRFKQITGSSPRAFEQDCPAHCRRLASHRATYRRQERGEPTVARLPLRDAIIPGVVHLRPGKNVKARSTHHSCGWAPALSQQIAGNPPKPLRHL